MAMATSETEGGLRHELMKGSQERKREGVCVEMRKGDGLIDRKKKVLKGKSPIVE